jgi:hypothetical protein
MNIDLRSAVAGLGLGLGITLATAAVAAPIMPKPIKKTLPQVGKPNPALFGLEATAKVQPRDLSDKGVTMDVIGPRRVESSGNRVIMTKHTQLMLQFAGSPNRAYRLDCKFSSNRQVHLMEYAAGKFLRQVSDTPPNGEFSFTTQTNPKRRKVKIFMQPSGNTDWRECTITPQ